MRKLITSNRETGAATVEVASSIWAFLLIAFATFQLIHAAYTAVAIKHVVAHAARQAIIGETFEDMNRVDTIKLIAQQMAAGFLISLPVENVHVCPISNPNCLPAEEDAGGPEAFVYIGAEVELYFLPFFNIPIGASAVVRNEPFA